MQDYRGGPNFTRNKRDLTLWEALKASVAQAAAFAVCGPSLDTRFRIRGQTPALEIRRGGLLKNRGPQGRGSAVAP